MNEIRLEVFDKPMCCSTGVCGAEVDPVLSRFTADLDWLKRQGVMVKRYNPTQEPMLFLDNQAVQRALQERGSRCLPLVLWGGETVASGAYPDRAALVEMTGLTADDTIKTGSVG